MRITGRLIGTQKPLFEDWSIDVEPYLEGVDDWTLSELIELVVFESSEFVGLNPSIQTFLKSINAKSKEPLFSPTSDLNSDLAVQPQSSSSAESGIADYRVQEAMGNAIESFEDDIYLVVVDGEDILDLDEYVQFHNESTITFVRLIPMDS